MIRSSSIVIGLGVIVAAAIGGLGALAVTGTDPTGEVVAVTTTVLETTTSTSTPPTTATSTTTTTTTIPARRATLLFTGDLLPHAPVLNQAARYADEGWDFTPMYEMVRPMVAAADVAICHLETPLSADDTAIAGYPFFNAPRAFAQAVFDVGFDGCSTASNHSMDKGLDGIRATIDVMQEIGLVQDGMARFGPEDEMPTLYDANGITVAHISATFGLNGFSLPAGEEYFVELIDPEAILAEARTAREAGAEFVVVSLHWGVEYRSEPTRAQLDALEAILPTPEVNLIVGHHAHVVQPIDTVQGEWVVFGLGNFLSNQSAACCATAAQDGLIVEVHLFEPAPGIIEVEGVTYTPTWVDRRDYTIVPVAQGLADDGYSDIHDELSRSWERTVGVVESRIAGAGLTVSREPPTGAG